MLFSIFLNHQVTWLITKYRQSTITYSLKNSVVIPGLPSTKYPFRAIFNVIFRPIILNSIVPMRSHSHIGCNDKVSFSPWLHRWGLILTLIAPMRSHSHLGCPDKVSFSHCLQTWSSPVQMYSLWYRVRENRVQELWKWCTGIYVEYTNIHVYI